MERFPTFAHLTLEDFDAYQAIAAPYYEYAHCSFSNVYCHEVLASMLNGNIILCYTPPEYAPPPAYTVIGHTKIVDTIGTVLEDARSRGYDYFLEAVPALALSKDFEELAHRYRLVEKGGDYVFRIDELLAHAQTDKKRSYTIRHCQKEMQSFILKRLYPDSEELAQLLQFGKTLPLSIGETLLLKRLPDILGLSEFYGLFAYGHGGMVAGSSIIEKKAIGYFSSPFNRHDHQIKGLGHYMRYLEAVALNQIGGEFFNVEDDFGNEGVAAFKKSWHPSLASKKYTIFP